MWSFMGDFKKYTYYQRYIYCFMYLQAFGTVILIRFIFKNMLNKNNQFLFHETEYLQVNN